LGGDAVTAARGAGKSSVAISVVVLLTAAVLVVDLCRPLDPWMPPTLDRQPDRQAEQEPRSTPVLSDLAVIWQRDLRQTVIHLPQPPEQPKSEPKLAVQLVGTAIECDRQYGVFQLKDNRTVVKAVGDEVDGYRIVAIDRGRARLRNGEREYELKVPWYDRIAAGEKE
jgi:hypothetical protein